MVIPFVFILRTTRFFLAMGYLLDVNLNYMLKIICRLPNLNVKLLSYR